MNDLLNTFLNWANTKYFLNKKENRSTVRERQIYWCSIGYNIGHEENGISLEEFKKVKESIQSIISKI